MLEILKSKKHLRLFAWLAMVAGILISLSSATTVSVFAAVTPVLTITEIHPNSTGIEAYEFIEIKNNSSSSVDLANYKVDYERVGASTKVWDMTTSQTLAAGAVEVIWIFQNDSVGKTKADFKANFSISIPDSQIYILDVRAVGAGTGLENTGLKSIVLKSDSGTEVSRAAYNDQTGNDTGTTVDGGENKSAVYEFPQYLNDGNKTMRKVARGSAPSPGGSYTAAEAPSIWITEMMPNPVDDGFEYIELYNNTTSDINLSGYKFKRVNDSITWTFGSFTLPAKGYAAVWIFNNLSTGYTTADFNNHYNTNLSSTQLYKLDLGTYSGLWNSAGPNTYEILNSSGTVICSASYNDAGTTTDASFEDRSILYDYPVTNTKMMRKVANDQYATPGEPYNMFYGQLHSHTSYSDGVQTPNDAYLWARDKGHADFFAVTDHSHYFDNVNDWANSTEWTDLKQKADYYYNENKYVSIAGYEMTWHNPTGRWGHMNVFNTDWFEYKENLKMNMPAFLDKLNQSPAGFAQFNHPMLTEWDNTKKWDYWTPERDNQVALIEINDPKEQYDTYIHALDKGWHVAPTNNGDNHSANWITRDNNRTVILAPRLNRDALFDAIRARRTYASWGDSDIRINYRINGKDMGSRLTGQSSLAVKVDVYNQNADNISKISVIANGGTVVASQTYSTNKVSFSTTLSPNYKYYFIRVDQADGDWAVTAPIWIEDPIPAQLSMDLKASSVSGVPVKVNANVKNTSGSSMSNVIVDFYKDTISGTPKGSTTISSIGAGATGTASLEWNPGITGNYTIIARVTIPGSPARYLVGKAVVPELIITELGVNTTNGADPNNSQYELYDFAEIYNNSKNTINLSGYKITIGPTTGSSRYTFDISGTFNIPSHSAGIIWFKNPQNTSLTVSDFNSNFGTSLTSSQIYSVSTSEEGPSGYLVNGGGARQVWIIKDNGDIVTMSEYSSGLDLKLDTTQENKSIMFSYPTDGTYANNKLNYDQPPTPGSVSSSQYPN
ncbi:hypothetical protein PAESOLCIP111_06172 [Paenibacillus solanacearum]|uniref:LTD domain-containing protein n=1 Tax=Paenibacillus solanacearum TaxID=2048548 RepID=A0A916K8Z4_9BACL|nr:lamin tail domain-containing protein [Paenibacillus solanacearum]CAG7650772.1 hypothetical protein PAESOLCIP111_06172 [Paenibacillus solanacearum]